MKQSIDGWLEGRQISRMKAEDRCLAKAEKKESAADKMIGELIRDGKVVYYIFPVGGRYRESKSFFELVDFLTRNKYF
jgi:hypothetical protein